MPHEAMKKESPTTQGQHHIARLHVRNPASRDLHDPTGPQGWQHAFAPHAQPQPPARAQAIRSQQRELVLPHQRRGVERCFHGQEVFREELQIAEVPAIFPHASAAVSKTRSKRNDGFWYGFLPSGFSVPDSFS